MDRAHRSALAPNARILDEHTMVLVTSPVEGIDDFGVAPRRQVRSGAGVPSRNSMNFKRTEPTFGERYNRRAMYVVAEADEAADGAHALSIEARPAHGEAYETRCE